MIFPISLFAQPLQWEGGVFLGAANYTGDLVESDYPIVRETNFAYGLYGRYHLLPNWKVKANLLRGKLSGNDANNSGTDFFIKQPCKSQNHIKKW